MDTLREKEVAEEILKWAGNDSPIIQQKNNLHKPNLGKKTAILKREIQLTIKENELLDSLNKFDKIMDDTIYFSLLWSNDSQSFDLDSLNKLKSVF